MILRILLMILLSVHLSNGQSFSKEEMKKMNDAFIAESLANCDTVSSSNEFPRLIRTALHRADSILAHYIGRDNLTETYYPDSTSSEIRWVEYYNGELISRSEHFSELHEIYDPSGTKFVSSFEVWFRTKGTEIRTGPIISFYANKKPLHIQGMIRISPDKNPINVLTQQEFMNKLGGFDRDKRLKKYLQRNGAKLRFSRSVRSIPNDVYSSLYYELYLPDYDVPGRYLFDPWTAELCCIIVHKPQKVN